MVLDYGKIKRGYELLRGKPKKGYVEDSSVSAPANVSGFDICISCGKYLPEGYGMVCEDCKKGCLK